MFVQIWLRIHKLIMRGALTGGPQNPYESWLDSEPPALRSAFWRRGGALS